MTDLTKAAREALEALNAMLTHMGMDEDEWNKPTFNQARAALATLRAALDEAPGEEREAFEAWMRVDNTLPLDRDAHGYADFTTGLLWHAWQAAQRANAPGGALAGGESGADARLGLAGANVTCRHDFVLQPSSSIELCALCGVSKTAARAMLAARPSAPKVALTAPAGLAHSDAQFWLDRRQQIIEAARREGYTIVTTASGVSLMRLGKIEAQGKEGGA